MPSRGGAGWGQVRWCAALLVLGALATAQAQSCTPLADWTVVGGTDNGNQRIITAFGCQVEFKAVFRVAVLDFSLGSPSMPEGATLSVEKNAGMDSETQYGYTAIFRWKPSMEQAGYHETVPLSKCVEGSGGGATGAGSITLQVIKCKYCINDKDSAHSVAAQFGRHWTQIWSSNHAVISPDTLAVGDLINLGNIYTTVAGDTWQYLAVRFGSSVQLLEDLNPELITADVNKLILAPGTQICVMPETCPERRPTVPGITW
ncbi:hypothetical protein T484DRAFT_1955712 [Baffinella frigidus]|nr:hypothetical protein T484DRAFT_1955712 [Cryptophyta sp. CCMP2293]